MKFIKWKSLAVTCLVCLLPILLGFILWNQLPDTMAIHFNINNEPDNFASKGFVVFGMPLLMVILQMFCCFINDINAYKHGERKKFERATKWIIPMLTVILQLVTLGYGLGWALDIRRVAAVLVGIVFLIIGNYLPKLDYVKNFEVDTTKARKINRFIGRTTVLMGILFIISTFFSPMSTIGCIILLIPYGLFALGYGIFVVRKG